MPYHPSTRRAFLSTVSRPLVGAALIPLATRRLFADRIPSGSTPNTLLPAQYEPTVLQTLAIHAIDAARGAGATYADVRVADLQHLHLGKDSNPRAFFVDIDATFTYGVRVLAEGHWAFVHGTVPDRDALTTAAQEAVTQARYYARSHTRPTRVDSDALTPVPIATGMWATPVTIDPFAVPLDQQMALLRSWAETASRIFPARGPGASVDWQRETRVFASTEGACVTQSFCRSVPRKRVYANRLLRGFGADLAVSSLIAQSGGYETVSNPAVHDDIVATAERAAWYASLPARALDVGRYPVVLDGTTLGAVLYTTIGQALELDRVLGEEADASGTSFLAPPERVLGTAIAAPLLHVTADRAMPSVTSVHWDDDGVEPVATPVITAGTLADYQTSRQTAPILAPWYRHNDQHVGSRGCAVASAADTPVQVRCAHLTVAPSTTASALDDLIREMPHGVVVCQGPFVAVDQQLSSASLAYSGVGVMLEVERGRIVRRVTNVALQWSTMPFWKGLAALGDASTVVEGSDTTYKGQPWHAYRYHTTAPAGLFKQVDVINIGGGA